MKHERHEPVVDLVDETLLAILDRSASLHDRLFGRFVPADAAPDEKRRAELLAKWQLRAAGDDPIRFARRLSWDGHDRNSIGPLLGEVRLAEGCPLPGWLKLLGHCAADASAARVNGLPLAPFLDEARRMPYEEVFVPYVRTAGRLLEERVGEAWDLLAEGARINLHRALLSQLTAISTVVLEQEYTGFRNRHCSPLWRLMAVVADDTSREVYNDFVQFLLVDGLKTFFREYAVLGRLVATSIENWIGAVAEFLLRLQADMPELSHAFFESRPPGLVRQIQTSMSDPHHRGRSVIRLSFAGDLKLIYKPKDLALERAFATWLGWWNDQGMPPGFKPLTVLCRPGYGWVEFVPHAPCQDQAEGRNYYVRAGMLLGLAYFMEATDCHHENVIAAGQFPQLVDAETLMHQDYRQVGATDQETAAPANASSLAQDMIWNSVLRTLFLPQWFIDRSGDSYDVSGFAAQGLRPNVPVLKNMNSDYMRLVMEPAVAGLLTNQPFLKDGSPLPAVNYIEELVTGFRQVYDHVLAQKDLLLSEAGPLREFAEQQVRYVLRPTRVYALLLKKAYWPEYLRDGIERSIELDAVARGFLHAETKPPWWPVVEADHRALDRLDIPYYSVAANSHDLNFRIPGSWDASFEPAVVPGFFGKTGFDSMKGIIRKASPDDLDRQEQFIRVSFHAHEARHGAGEVAAKAPASPGSTGGPPLSPGEMIAEALKIADSLVTSAIRSADGSAAWLGMSFKPGTDRYQFRTIGDSLFAGCAGVGLFLAAAARVTGQGKYRESALAAVKSLRATLHNGREYWARETGLGGFSGTASVAYALSAMGALLVMEELQADADLAALSITPGQITRDTFLDLTLGSAGALLVLVELYRQRGNELFLDLALQCGEKVLQGRKSFGGFRVWATVEKEGLTGLSHGAAGFAHALRKLFQASGQTRFQAAAEEAVAFEDALFLPDRGNWPDMRRAPNARGERYCMTAWCHGAGGIALSRLAMLSSTGLPSLRRDAEAGLNTLRTTPAGALDHLCCGTMGLAAILERGARQLNRPDLLENARQKVTAVARSAGSNDGRFALFYDIPRTVPNPGLMQGTAGIGYALLQMGSGLRELPEVMLLKL